LARIVSRINDIQPDLILLGGDYVHYHSQYIKPAFLELGKLRADYGVNGVLGNHDHRADASFTRTMMAQQGICSINNQSVWVKKGCDNIKIGGVGDFWEDRQILGNTLNNLSKSQFAILVSHNPDYLESFNSDLIDLTLLGHTHGGQVTFFGLWAPILPSAYGLKYRYGLIDRGTTRSYISSGIGTGTLPFRFFCRPEIVVITLRKEGTQS
jgi:predicted MPP superfamily phosphohydrolase